MHIRSFVDGKSAAFGLPGLTLIRPEDGATTGDILEAGDAGVEAAVAAAAAAFDRLRGAPQHQRIAWLKTAATALSAASEEIAQIIAEDVGKPIRLARGEVKRGVEFIEGCAAALPNLNGEILPLDSATNGAGLLGMVRHVPFGVVAAVAPFNAPVNLLVQKLAPAVAAGNTVVVKPAPAGLRTALKLAAIFSAAGWPDGLFNVVSGDRATALSLVVHPLVRAVSVTGGTAAGEALARAAGAKKFLAELGSNAANLVFADADLKVAAQKIAAAGFEASGQQCISAQRVLVQRAALEAFLPLLVEAAKALNVGAVGDPRTDIGPMVTLASAERVMALVADAQAKGARALLPPVRDGALVSPGILVDVTSAMRLWHEEIFGPVIVVLPFDTVDEAIAMANDSPFGLQAAAFTANLATALRLADAIDVGSLWINEASRFRLDMYPFGGVKSSGVGREGIRYAIQEMSQLKFIGIRP
ncbi:aldehyde dehydrogenase family protein [Humitalea sp. 24SJ18S-53]|uniref:aldehyde dehydrogenase family protein n=1 Tax=Humitalea sp. 24SJ18S-53 TaxID=3422307 RepID=UPI003D674D0E